MSAVSPVTRLYREARRRKVFRTAALYVVGAWLALQVAALMFPGFGIPDSAIRSLIWAAALGLPVAAIFGWLFEIGPGGIRRTALAASGEAALPQPLARRDYLILAAFAAIAAVLVYRAAQEVREAPKEAALAEAMASDPAAERLPNSVAVLPFANISEDRANEYFCDGIAEEILTRLGAIQGLNVIARTSSFAFKGSDYGIERISALLGVRYVLQGSVRKAGDQLRVSAQLLDAGGVQVWSESFDRQLKNIFEIQSEIAAAVASTVASHVVPESDTGHQPDVAAYDHYLRGRELLHARDPGARRELTRAVELDPKFAEAHAELAIASMVMTGETDERTDRSRQSIDRALQLQPRLLRALAAQGLWLMNTDPPDFAGAERVLRDVLAHDPNMSDALLWLTGALGQQGRDAEARTVLERAALIDPMHPSITANLAGQLHEAGETDRARQLLERQLESPNPAFMIYGGLAEIYRATGRLVESNALAKRAALGDPGEDLNPLALSYAGLGDYAAAEAWFARSLHANPAQLGARVLGIALETWQGRYADVGQRMVELFGADVVLAPPADLPLHGRVIRGALLARGGEYEAAIRHLEPIIDPDTPELTYIEKIVGMYALPRSRGPTFALARTTRLRACWRARRAGVTRNVPQDGCAMGSGCIAAPRQSCCVATRIARSLGWTRRSRLAGGSSTCARTIRTGRPWRRTLAIVR